MEPRTPTLQVDSLPAELQGKPKNIGVDPGIDPGVDPGIAGRFFTS